MRFLGVECCRIELAAALYAYCEDYHGGQWSREYRILSRLVTAGFRPGNGWCGIRDFEEWSTERAIYDALVEQYQRRPDPKFLTTRD